MNRTDLKEILVDVMNKSLYFESEKVKKRLGESNYECLSDILTKIKSRVLQDQSMVLEVGNRDELFKGFTKVYAYNFTYEVESKLRKQKCSKIKKELSGTEKYKESIEAVKEVLQLFELVEKSWEKTREILKTGNPTRKIEIEDLLDKSKLKKIWKLIDCSHESFEKNKLIDSSESRFALIAEITEWIHDFYSMVCAELGLHPLVMKPHGVHELLAPKEGEKFDEKLRNLQVKARDWQKLYWDIMDELELQNGLTVRFHTLDDYDQPMGESKLDLIGAARASRLAYKRD